MPIQHICIKPNCGKSYADDDVDAYYCPDCVIMNKEIAKRINATIKTSSEKTKSDLEIYDELSKGRGTHFVNAKDLGIKL